MRRASCPLPWKTSIWGGGMWGGPSRQFVNKNPRASSCGDVAMLWESTNAVRPHCHSHTHLSIYPSIYPHEWEGKTSHHLALGPYIPLYPHATTCRVLSNPKG